MKELIGRWNYYFLRYGAGTIIGAIIVALFVRRLAHFCPSFSNSFFQNQDGHFELSGAAVTLFLALGFAYCYIASAPGTVFHAARGLFWSQPEPDECKLKKPCLWALVSLSLIFSLILAAIVGCHNRHGLEIIIMPIFGFTVLTLQWLLLAFTFTRFERIEKFYDKLITKRAPDSIMPENSSKEMGITEKLGNRASEYVESYRDLREHGNAFEVVIFEILFALTLVNLNFCSALWFVILWIAPAAFCWIVGTRLEFHFIRNSS